MRLYSDYKGNSSKGNIEFWSHCFNYPVISIKAIENPIQKIIYDKRENVLFCVGIEVVCMFSLPMKWCSEMMRAKNDAKNEYSIIENNTQNKDNISLLKDAFSRLSFDIDTTNRTTNDDTNNNSISNIFNMVNNIKP